MVKRVFAYILWLFSIFTELFIVTIFKVEVEDQFLLSIMPLGLNITLMLLATYLYNKSIVHDNKKISNKERERRKFESSLPIYLNIVCFFPSAFYYLFNASKFQYDKKQKKTIVFALCFTIIWLIAAYFFY